MLKINPKETVVVVYFRYIVNEDVVSPHEVVNNDNLLDILVHGGDCIEDNENWDAVDIESNYDNEDKRQGGDEIQEGICFGAMILKTDEIYSSCSG